MSAAVHLREDIDASELRALARGSGDTRQCRRLLTLAPVAEGKSQAEAARIGGMDRQTLRDRVHRFNAEGADGLLDRKAPGAAPKLTPEQKSELAALVEAGPHPEVDGVVRWRRVDLKTVIEQRFGMVYHERSVPASRTSSAWPRHPAQDAARIEDYKKTSCARWPRR